MSALRVVFIVMAALTVFGIWLTGFQNVHWVLYIPPAAMAFAGLTGICPGYILFKKLGLKPGF